MLPDNEREFEDWYQQEHLVDGSKIGGWRRTERYELLNPLRTEDAPKYLTLVSRHQITRGMVVMTEECSYSSMVRRYPRKI